MDYFIILYIIVLSAISFTLMGIDKSRAIKNKWRISEKTLLTITLVGGACGGLIGMYIFRHKTKHTKFTIGLPILSIIHIVILFSVIQKF